MYIYVYICMHIYTLYTFTYIHVENPAHTVTIVYNSSYDSFICVTWLIACDMADSHVTWLINTRDMTHCTQHNYTTHSFVHLCDITHSHMGWLRWVGSLKLQVSFAKKPYKRDGILQKRPIILRSLIIVATPYQERKHNPCLQYMNESRHVHKRVTSRICMSFVTHANASRHIEYESCHTSLALGRICGGSAQVPHTWMSYITHMNELHHTQQESCRTHGQVTSHTSTRHVTHMCESHTNVWVTSRTHMYGSRHVQVWVMAHLASNRHDPGRIGASVTHINESRHTHTWVTSHIDESRHKHEWVTWMFNGTHC